MEEQTVLSIDGEAAEAVDAAEAAETADAAEMGTISEQEAKWIDELTLSNELTVEDAAKIRAQLVSAEHLARVSARQTLFLMNTLAIAEELGPPPPPKQAPTTFMSRIQSGAKVALQTAKTAAAEQVQAAQFAADHLRTLSERERAPARKGNTGSGFICPVCKAQAVSADALLVHYETHTETQGQSDGPSQISVIPSADLEAGHQTVDAEQETALSAERPEIIAEYPEERNRQADSGPLPAGPSPSSKRTLSYRKTMAKNMLGNAKQRILGQAQQYLQWTRADGTEQQMENQVQEVEDAVHQIELENEQLGICLAQIVEMLREGTAESQSPENAPPELAYKVRTTHFNRGV
jgi:hypothetical protein